MRHHSHRQTLMLALATAIFGVPLAAAASVPATLGFEGRLETQAGGPVADGDYKLSFALYADAKTETATWTEAATVKVSAGRFAHALGSVQPITPVVLDASGAGWVGVRVGQDPELPRSPLLAVGFAVRAAIAEGLVCSGCVGVGALKFDGDVDLGGNGLKAKNAAFSGDVVAKTVTATGFVGDGSSLTGLKIAGGACKAGEFVTGVQSDGGVVCAPPAPAKIIGGKCGVGQVVTQVSSTGEVSCANPLATGVEQKCPIGAAVQGLDASGKLLCSQASTSSFKWTTTSEKAVSAGVNNGYFAASNTETTTLTLPAAPAVGDTVRVVGMGFGGWVVAQNKNQRVALGHWYSFPDNSYRVVAGDSLISCGAGGVRVSKDSGSSWTSAGGSCSGPLLAASSTGQALIGSDGYWSGDGGKTWKQWNPTAVTGLSHDGLVAVSAYSAGSNTRVFSTSKSGISGLGSTFYTVNGSLSLSQAAVSGDGSNLLISTDQGIYTSAGDNKWTLRPGSPASAKLAVSTSGKEILAGGAAGLHLSSDGGLIWKQYIAENISSVAISGDGQATFAVVGGSSSNGRLVVSTNGGQTWQEVGGQPVSNLRGSTPDGRSVFTSSSVYRFGTVVGTQGFLRGGMGDAVELVYSGKIGDIDQFVLASYQGDLRAH